MKTILYLYSLIALLFIASCGMDPKIDGVEKDGKGKVALSLGAMNDFEVIEGSTKATGVNVTVDDFTVNLKGKSIKGNVVEQTWASYAEMPSVVTIPAGEYTLEAYNGHQRTGFEKPYFYGSKNFSVGIQEMTEAQLVCQLACVKASIEFTPEFMQHIIDGSAVLAHSDVFLEYTPTTTQNGYIATPKDGILLLTIRGKYKDDPTKSFEKTYQITNVESKQWHKIKLNINTEAGLTTDNLIKIDATVDEKDTVISIPGGDDVIDNNGDNGDWGNSGGNPDPDPEPQPNGPTITGSSFNGVAFDLAFPVNIIGSTEAVANTILDVSIEAPKGGIKNLFLVMTSTDPELQSIFSSLTSDNSPWDLANPSTMEPAHKSLLENLGVLDASKPIKDQPEYLFSVGGFMSFISVSQTEIFQHTFKITVVDGEGNTTLKKLIIHRSI